MVEVLRSHGSATRVVVWNPLDASTRKSDEVPLFGGETVGSLAPRGILEDPLAHVVQNGWPKRLSECASVPVSEGDHLIYSMDMAGPFAVIPGTVALFSAIAQLSGPLSYIYAKKQGGYLGAGADVVTGTALTIGGVITGQPEIVLPGIGLALSGLQSIYNTSLNPGSPRLSLASGGSDFSQSPTYSLGGLFNTYVNGLPIPIVYGYNRIAGQVIQQFFRIDASGVSRLHTLVALGFGPFESVGGFSVDTDNASGSAIPVATFEINGSSATLFQGTEISVRMGTYHQAPIPGFEDTVTSQTVNATITGAGTTITTSASVSSFEVNLEFQAGLFALNASGQTIAYTEPNQPAGTPFKYKVEWRQTGGAFGAPAIVTVSQGPKLVPFATKYRVDNPLGTNPDGSPKIGVLDIRVTRISAVDDSSHVSILNWTTLNEISELDQNYPGIALVAWKNVATSQLQGSIPLYTTVVYGKKLWVWDGVSETAPTFKTGAQIYTSDQPNKIEVEFGPTVSQPLLGLPGTHGITSAGFQFATGASSAVLNGVALRFRKNPNCSTSGPGNVTLRVEGDTGGLPNGSVVATAVTVSAANFLYPSNPKASTGGDVTWFAFSSPPTLSANTTYHITWTGSWAESSTEHASFELWQTAPSGQWDYETKNNGIWVNDVGRVPATMYFQGQRPGENPAWWLMDMLMDARYGLGPWVKLQDINLPSFLDAANYNDDCYDANGGNLKGPRWSGGGLVIDFRASGWDMALRMASGFRSSITKIGRRITVLIDRQTTVSQLFTKGNVIRGSVRRGWLSVDDRPNRIEIQYANKNLNWAVDTASKQDPALVTSGDDVRTMQMNLFGIIYPLQAYREATYRYNFAKTIDETLEWKSPVDAVSCNPGDVVRFAHDLLNTLFISGRSAAASGGFTFFVDQAVTIPASPAYELVVRTTATGVDALQYRNITASQVLTAGASMALTGGSWNPGDTPAQYDVYAIRATTVAYRDWRVISISVNEDKTVDISAIEYDATIYNDDPGEVEEFTDELPDPLLIPEAPSRVGLTEVHQLELDGSLRSSILVSWVKPRGFDRAEVWWRISGSETEWIGAGTYQGESATIVGGFIAGEVYEVAVRAVSMVGARGAIEQSPRNLIAITGPTSPPPDVTNFVITRSGDKLIFTWDDMVTGSASIVGSNREVQHPGKIDGYQIREGPSWSVGRVLSGKIAGTSFTYPTPGTGTFTYWIAAFTRAGVFSTGPLAASYVSQTDALTIAVTRGESSLSWPGGVTSMSVQSASNPTYELRADASSANYETPAITVSSIRTTWRPFVHIERIPYDPIETWPEHDYTWGSEAATRRFWSGWNENPIDPGSHTWADEDYSFDSYRARYSAMGGTPLDITRGRTSLNALISVSPDGISYSPDQAFSNGEVYDMGYCTITVDVTGDADATDRRPTQRIAFSDIRMRWEKETYFDYGAALLVPAGSAVYFNRPFLATPVVQGTIFNAASGDTLIISVIVAAGFVAQVVDGAGAGKLATIEWTAFNA